MNKDQLTARAKELGIDTKGLDTDEKLQAAIAEKAPTPPNNIPAFAFIRFFILFGFLVLLIVQR